MSLGENDTCICMAESLCGSPETVTTLSIDYTPIQNFWKKIFFKNSFWNLHRGFYLLSPDELYWSERPCQPMDQKEYQLSTFWSPLQTSLKIHYRCSSGQRFCWYTGRFHPAKNDSWRQGQDRGLHGMDRSPRTSESLSHIQHWSRQSGTAVNKTVPPSGIHCLVGKTGNNTIMLNK